MRKTLIFLLLTAGTWFCLAHEMPEIIPIQTDKRVPCVNCQGTGKIPNANHNPKKIGSTATLKCPQCNGRKTVPDPVKRYKIKTKVAVMTIPTTLTTTVDDITGMLTVKMWDDLIQSPNMNEEYDFFVKCDIEICQIGISVKLVNREPVYPVEVLALFADGTRAKMPVQNLKADTETRTLNLYRGRDSWEKVAEANLTAETFQAIIPVDRCSSALTKFRIVCKNGQEYNYELTKEMILAYNDLLKTYKHIRSENKGQLPTNPGHKK